uniref:Uncharacterized protein n=1 Tax=Arundo donax TaxID=35708 RepID=A0A0A8ZMZ2_ARUDO
MFQTYIYTKNTSDKDRMYRLAGLAETEKDDERREENTLECNIAWHHDLMLCGKTNYDIICC